MRKLLGMVMVALLVVSCVGCGNQNKVEEKEEVSIVTTSEGVENEESDSAPMNEEEVSEDTDASEDSVLPVAGNLVNLNDAPTQSMLQRSVTNEGNLARLAKAMEKSKSGEEITIAFLGGSITQGSSASSENQYVNQVTRWWEENLGSVQCVNAGVGATDSYLGVHRVDRDVLAKNPDVIFIEFAVNDVNAVFNKYTYDSLLLKCLKAEQSPAVILLMMTQEDGTSLFEVHSKLGIYYDLPVLSYRDMVYPEVSVGNITWSKISPDNIHPNDVGHTILSKMITDYLDCVIKRLDSIDTQDTQISVENYTEFAYEDAHLLNRKSEEATKAIDEGEFTQEVSFQTFTDGWGTRTGGSITFDVTARNFGILYQKDTSGTYGKAEIYIDDVLFGYLDGNFAGGWGNYVEGYQVYSRKTREQHTIKIVVPEGKSFDLINLLIS